MSVGAARAPGGLERLRAPRIAPAELAERVCLVEAQLLDISRDSASS